MSSLESRQPRADASIAQEAQGYTSSSGNGTTQNDCGTHLVMHAALYESLSALPVPEVSTDHAADRFAAARPSAGMLERIATFAACRIVTTARWEPSRAIFQNYFVMPYQEFHFVNGCLVLGGGNSTGKTSVLTALVTMVLDNDKRAERFDPSGKRVRNIAYYVLGKPEMRFFHKNRIAYIALEFRHTGTGAYRTIGLGIQGHRAGSDGHPQTDSWGFLVADGRRIGHDLALFDQDGGKQIPLSRARLIKALGADLHPVNRVVDDVDSYREMVNAALFGFRSDHQFQDLLNILTSLRASKLANTIRPSVVNAFLQDSLRPLDEDLMMDAGRVYERIDQYQQRVDQLTEQVIILDDLNQAEGTWRLAASCREAGRFRDATREAERAISRLDRTNADIVRETANRAAAETSIAEITSTIGVKSSRKKVLDDMTELKDVKRLHEYKTEFAEATRVADSAHQSVAEANDRHATLQTRVDSLHMEWTSTIEKIVARTTDLAMDAEAVWDTALHYGRAVISAARQAAGAGRTPEPGAPLPRIQTGDISITSVRASYEVQTAALQAIGRAIREVDDANRTLSTERDLRSREALDLNTASTAVETKRAEERAGRIGASDAAQRWADTARETVPLTDEIIDQVITTILDLESDPNDLTAPFRSAITTARTTWLEHQSVCLAAMQIASRNEEDAAARLRAKQAEHEETPPIRPDQARARAAMLAAGVRVAPLYHAVDFSADLSDAEAGRLEHILEEAHLLDALLMSAHDREYARMIVSTLGADTLAAGVETWLEEASTDAAHTQTRTLADYLVPAEGIEDPATIVRALRTVRVAATSNELSPGATAGDSAVALDGGWVHGALSGHTSGTRSGGRYIGLLNRERARREAISRLEEALAAASEECTRLESDRVRIADQLNTLAQRERDLNLIPNIRALPELRLYVKQAEHDVAKYEARLELADGRVRSAQVKVTEMHRHLDTACDAIQWMRERTHESVEQAAATFLRLRDLALEIQQQVSATTRYGDDFARESGQLSKLAAETTAAKTFLRGRRDAVARAAAKVQAIQDLLTRDDIKGFVAEAEELFEVLNTLAENLDAEKTKFQTARANRETSERALPDHVAAADRTRATATLLYDGFLNALAAHAVTSAHSARARRDESEAVSVATELLNAVPVGQQSAVALEETREKAYTVMDTFRVKHTAVLTPLQPAVDRNAGYSFFYHGRPLTTRALLEELTTEQASLEMQLRQDQQTLLQKFMSEEILSAIHAAIDDTNTMIRLVNAKLGQIKSTKSKQLRFRWRPIRLPGMSTGVSEVAKLLDSNVTYWSDEERATLVRFIEERLAYVKSVVKSGDAPLGYVEALKGALDYRNWYGFVMETFEKRWIEFTDKDFGSGSEGEKAVDMLAPLFAVVHARYANAAPDAPRLVGMDEAMAGLDATNTTGLFGLLRDFEFAFLMTSEKLWGVSPELPGCATYQLWVDQPKDPSLFAATMFLWDGVTRTEDDARLRADGIVPERVARKGA